MTTRLFACLAIAVVCCRAANADDASNEALRKQALQREDLHSIQDAFRKKDPALEWFEAVSKISVDTVRSVVVAQAAPLALQPAGANRPQKLLPVFEKRQLGVFLVSGASNRVERVLDISPLHDVAGFPTVEQGGANSIDLHFYSEYGIYQGSLKYFYDPASAKPARKLPFSKLALRSSALRDGKLVYGVSAWSEAGDQSGELVIEPRPGGALPAFRITRPLAPGGAINPEPGPMRLPDGRLVEIMNTPAGQPHRPAGISIAGVDGMRRFYPVPIPTLALRRQLRPDEQPTLEIQNGIGPFAREGSTIWFANSFYDGEGVSGVGAIGSFDLRSLTFEIRYLPEVAAWSGSAMRLDGEDLWLGLMRQPEGAAFSGGLLRWNTRTHSVAKYAIPDYIRTIDRLGDTIYCGTDDGLYMLRDGGIAHVRFEPDARGQLGMIER